MLSRQAANIVSTPHLANVTIPANRNRSYFMLIAGADAAELYLGGGAGEIPIAAGEHFEPRVCPTGEIRVVCPTVFTIVMG